MGEYPLIKVFLNDKVVNTAVKTWMVCWSVFLTYNCTPSETEGEAPQYGDEFVYSLDMV